MGYEFQDQIAKAQTERESEEARSRAIVIARMTSRDAMLERSLRALVDSWNVSPKSTRHAFLKLIGLEAHEDYDGRTAEVTGGHVALSAVLVLPENNQ